MSNYKKLSEIIENKILADKKCGRTSPFACDESSVLRRKDNPHDQANAWRTAFIRDVDKIMHCPFYARYADKTQVFSLYKNDDITRRALHIQLVSRTARTIGKALGLNLDLIEAISLGHDIGHTPFGHTGEKLLDEIFRAHTGLRFAHNVHSVRVLDEIFPLNLSLQTLNGIASHNGEMELEKYTPVPLSSFAEFDRQIEDCYKDLTNVLKLVPCTLEGCLVRLSDIIAYLGKDRHDMQKIGKLEIADSGLGEINAEIINNLIVNVIENSYGNPYIKMDAEHFTALEKVKKENYRLIYATSDNNLQTLQAMMENLYEKLLNDLKNSNLQSPIFTHHVDYVNKPYYKREKPYLETEINQIVVDYIASMTDDYFVELHKHLFPKSSLLLQYTEYFK